MGKQSRNAVNHWDYEERIARNRARRNRELRRHLTAGILALTVCLFALLFGLNGVMSDAQEEGATVYKYYRSVAILPRDTVETLADTCLSANERALVADRDAYASEIRAINHLAGDEQPLAGTRLVIPYYSEHFAENE